MEPIQTYEAEFVNGMVRIRPKMEWDDEHFSMREYALISLLHREQFAAGKLRSRITYLYILLVFTFLMTTFAFAFAWSF